MNTPTKRTVVHSVDGQQIYRAVVQEATAQMGMLRSVLISSASSNGKDTSAPADDPMSGDGIAQTAHWIMRHVLYPALIAGTVEHDFDHWPISFDEFCELPEPFEIAWETAVFDLNPHWRLKQGEPSEADQKKAPISSSG